MKIRTLFLATALLLGFSVSCKKSSTDPVASGGCTSANLTAKATAYSNALSAYVAAPTDNTKCKALVVAYDDYLGTFASNCSLVTAVDVAAIQKSRADIAAMCK